MLTLFCRHSGHLAHLEAEIEWYREQLLHERQRAEQAVDRLLATRQIGPIAPPRPLTDTPIDSAMRELLTAEDFQRIGEAE